MSWFHCRLKLCSKFNFLRSNWRRNFHRLDVNQRVPFYQQSEKELQKLYALWKTDIYEKDVKLEDMSRSPVYANTELSFRYLNSYGFDYDYTLALYSDELHDILYQVAVDNLIGIHGYPQDIRKFRYDGSFPIRGLHYDIEKGYLMKLDSYNRVQLGTVYKGYQKVSDDDVIKEYGGTLINVDRISQGFRRNDSTIFQQMDLFSMAFLSLLTNVTNYFMENNIQFDPWYIYYDVENATQLAHKSGRMHQAIIDDLDRFLPKNNTLETYMNRLLSKNKKLFLITNSSFNFVDKGMSHLFHADWRDLFEVIVVNARKPRFFSDVDRAFRPFRNIDLKTGRNLWDHVKSFQKHGVYGEGNIESFSEFTGYEGASVIYFGDHVFSDLMDPVSRIGWRTGAIIPDLESELKICNTEDYIRSIEWLVTLEHLITALQVNGGSDMKGLLKEWRSERKELRKHLKNLFNPYFGSMFRTHQNPTSFSCRITHYADLYTSSVTNFLNYSDEFHFLPSRNLLPHERF